MFFLKSAKVAEKLQLMVGAEIAQFGFLCRKISKFDTSLFKKQK
jgi:hypothetical protein